MDHPRCAVMCPIAPPEGRFGDLLPLPLPALPTKPPGPCHRATVRRHQREALLCRAERESVAALNRLAGFSEPSLWPSFSRNSAQDSSLEIIHRIQAPEDFRRGRRCNRGRPFRSCCGRLLAMVGRLGARTLRGRQSVTSFRSEGSLCFERSPWSR